MIDGDTLLGVAVVVLAVIVTAAAVRNVLRRRKGWQALAGQRGWRFEDEAGMRAFLQHCQGFKHFSLGMRQWVENVVSGQHRGMRFWLAEFGFQRHTGKHGKTAWQTICVVEQGEGDRPQVIAHNADYGSREQGFLRDMPMPMEPIERAGGGFGLWCADADAARAFMSPTRLEQLSRLGEPRLHLEVSGRWLLVHRGAILNAQEGERLLEDSFAIGEILAPRPG